MPVKLWAITRSVSILSIFSWQRRSLELESYMAAIDVAKTSFKNAE